MGLSLGLGLDLGRRGGRTGGGAAPWLPSSLTGYVGSPHSVAYFRSLGTLWQDTAKTIPATADGDPVRVASCDGVDWAAPSDAARPLLWDEGGGLWSFYFDGVDDCLNGPALPVDAAYPLTLAASAIRGGGDDVVFGSEGSLTNRSLLYDSSNVGILIQNGGNNLYITAALAADEWAVRVGLLTGTTASFVGTLRVNGTVAAGPTAGSGAASLVDSNWVAGALSAGSHYDGRIAGFFPAFGPRSAGEVDLIESYLTGLTP
jgi:hypothetical protein